MVYEKHVPGSEYPDGLDAKDQLIPYVEPTPGELSQEKHLPSHTTEDELIKMLREALIKSDERPLY